MFCHNCGNKLEENNRFCAKCGAPVAAASAAPIEEPAVQPVEEPVVEFIEEPIAEPQAEVIEEPVAEVIEEVAEPEIPEVEAVPAFEPSIAPNPAYMPPRYVRPEADGPRGSKGMSIASLVLGVCSIAFCWVPFMMIITEILGTIFGIKGIRNRNGSGMAITGLVLSLVAFLITFVMTILVLVLTSEGLLVDSSFYY